jgi:hypothetical protein
VGGGSSKTLREIHFGEIANIMTAIKAGILTATTKAELEKAESERDRLHQTVETATAQADKVVTLLPRAKERYWRLRRSGRCPPSLSRRHGSRCERWSGKSG